MKKLILIMTVFFSCMLIVNAGEDKYSIGEKFTFKSEVLNEERSVFVYTPFSYNTTNQSYPVMYLLDGDAHFHHVSGIVQFLAGNGIIPEMIVVGVLNVDRTRDFSPTHNEKWPTTGGAEKFLSFMGSELIPFIEKNFRTEPYNLLVGHSFGGEFAAYALVNKPELFNALIAVSPYLMYDDDFIVKETASKLLEKYQPPVHFYMTIGEEPDYYKSLDDFAKIIADKSPEGLELTYVKMENKNHGSSPHLSIYEGLENIYSGWNISQETFTAGLDAIEKHYQMLSENFGYKISTPELIINALGYYYLNKKEYETAINVFTENVKRYPESANVYDSLGEAYEKNEKLTDAEKNYSHAVEIAQKENHQNLKIYSKNLERVQTNLAQE